MNKLLGLLGATSIALLLTTNGAVAHQSPGQMGQGPGMMMQGNGPAATPSDNGDHASGPPAGYGEMMGYGDPWMMGPGAESRAERFGRGYGPGPWMMGSGWMGPGMMGGGYGPGPWMMGRGWMGPGMMGGYGRGPWMMGSGWMGRGMMGDGYGPGPWMMGRGWMGPGMMGGYGHGPWMMGSGWMGPGMMGGGYGPGPWTMGRDWMGPGMMGWGGYGSYAGVEPEERADLNLTVTQVEHRMDRWLAIAGNPHIKLGKVTEQKDGTITADIVTTDNGGLVQRYTVNRKTGFIEPAGE